MQEGTNAVLVLDGTEYELSHYKIIEDDENYFCYSVELSIADKELPKVVEDESYVARLIVNGDAVWYFPWVWFKNTDKKGPKLSAAVHGAIFCPFGLTEEEENRYDALNLIIASDVCYNMTAEVWQNLLLIFGDWLKAKSVPQHQEYIELAKEIDLDADQDMGDEDDEEDDEEDEYVYEDEFEDEEDDIEEEDS